MKQFFKFFFKSLSRLTPHFISLLMVIAACIGHFGNGDISTFEFWVLLGLSQLISMFGTFFNSIEESIEEANNLFDSQDQQINS